MTGVQYWILDINGGGGIPPSGEVWMHLAKGSAEGARFNPLSNMPKLKPHRHDYSSRAIV